MVAIQKRPLNSETLLKEIEADIRRALVSVRELEDYQHHGSPEPFDEEEETENLAFQCDLIKRKVLSVLEILSLLETVNELRSEFDEAELLKWGWHGDVAYSAKLGVLRSYADIAAHACGKKQPLRETRSILRNILESLGHLISSESKCPGTEPELQRFLYVYIQAAFPDVLREVAVPKGFKEFRPDYGIPSIRTAVELKFCNDANEVKTALSGIYEDVCGYAEGEWDYFYAVIYVTDFSLTQKQAEAYIDACGKAENWDVVVVHGPGARKKAASTNASTGGNRQRCTKK